jgi:hypothetical protein
MFVKIIKFHKSLQVEEDASKQGNLAFVDFKRMVWHESFEKLLDSIKEHSKTGFSVICGDRVERLLFPFVVILSADYEEQ